MIKLMRELPTFVLFQSQMESSFMTPYWQEAIKVAKEKDFNLNICNGRICDIRDFPHLDHIQENVTNDLVSVNLL